MSIQRMRVHAVEGSMACFQNTFPLALTVDGLTASLFTPAGHTFPVWSFKYQTHHYGHIGQLDAGSLCTDPRLILLPLLGLHSSDHGQILLLSVHTWTVHRELSSLSHPFVSATLVYIDLNSLLNRATLCLPGTIFPSPPPIKDTLPLTKTKTKDNLQLADTNVNNIPPPNSPTKANVRGTHTLQTKTNVGTLFFYKRQSLRMPISNDINVGYIFLTPSHFLLY